LSVKPSDRLHAMLAMFLLILALVFALIAVHEVGHYLAGLIEGIPPREMKIVLFAFPQHVAMRDGETWVSPVRDIERYIAVTRRYFSTRAAAFRYVAGGMVFELGVTAALCLATWRAGWHAPAFSAATMSLSLFLVNVLLMDLPRALRYRRAAGDVSGLWQIARLPGVVLSVVMLAARIALVIVAA
jgi:hypothetical protein